MGEVDEFFGEHSGQQGHVCRRIGDGTQRREWLRVPAPPKGMHANGPASGGEIAGQSPARGLGR